MLHDTKYARSQRTTQSLGSEHDTVGFEPIFSLRTRKFWTRSFVLFCSAHSSDSCSGSFYDSRHR